MRPASCRMALVAVVFALASAMPAEAAGKRVIALGGDITEIVYALGEGGQLAARDATSQFPPEVQALPDVGYLRQLGAEGVLSLRPDLILASASAGPEETLQQIRSAGVEIVRLKDGFSPEALIDKVEDIAQALQVPEKGKELAAKLRAEIGDAKAAIAKLDGRPKVLFIIAAAGGAPQAAGRHTAADALLGLAGGENVFSAHEGYKAISLEVAAAASPEAIAMMSHTLDTMGGAAGIAAHPALRLTAAATTGRIVARDGGYLLGFGPRLPQAMVDFAKAIRGERAQ